jgi:serine protease
VGEQLFSAGGQPLPLNPNPARVVNISFGGTAACSAAYQSAVDALAARDAVVVAAAGNEHGAITRPANCERVIGVAAVNRDGFKSTYSNFGARLVIATVGGDPFDDGRWGALLGDDGLLTVDNLGVHAPDIQSVTYSRISGTSFAAPVVAGVVSLMLAVNPQLSAAQVINGVRVSARPHVVSAAIGACSAQNPGRCICSSATCGAGLLDAEQAVLYAQAPLAYGAPSRQAANVDSADVLAAVAAGADRDPNPSGGGSGGGAVNSGWLLALAVAALTLRRWRV